MAGGAPEVLPEKAGGLAPMVGDCSTVEAEVERRLADLRLLMRFISSNLPRVLMWRSVPQHRPTALDSAVASDTFGQAGHVALLASTPAAAIASDPDLLGQLYSALEALSQVVTPASVGSIHLTSAFAGNALEVQPSPAVKALARNLIHWFIAMAVFGFAAFIATVLLLIHVDDGRQALRLLVQVKVEYQTGTRVVGRRQRIGH